MSKVIVFSIAHTCGHVAEHAMPAEQAGRRVAWLCNNSCLACWQKAGSVLLSLLDADLQNIGFQLPQLHGSKKQVAWASLIRAKFLHMLFWSVKLSPARRIERHRYTALMRRLLAQKSVKFWIENRQVFNPKSRFKFSANKRGRFEWGSHILNCAQDACLTCKLIDAPETVQPQKSVLRFFAWTLVKFYVWLPLPIK